MALSPTSFAWLVLVAAIPAAWASAQNKTGASADYLRRGDSSRRRLQVRWTTPAVLVREKSLALEIQKAIEELRGKDPRPLLIHREAETSHKKRDDRLIRHLQTEEVRLLTHWFHCIRLGRKVLDPKHPYHSLFVGKRPPQLLVISWDGTTTRSLIGDEDKRTTVGTIITVAKLEYRGDALAAIQQWRKLLDQWDKLDALAEDYEARLSKAIDKHGQGSSSAKKWRSRLEGQNRARDVLAKKETKVQTLRLKHDPKARSYIDFEAEAAAEVKALRGKAEAARLKKKLQQKKNEGQPDGDR
jgi:hypothetical protein